MGVIELASGLESQPDAKGQSEAGKRKRVVWSNQERMRLDRVARDFKGHGDVFLLRCGNVTCADRAITLVSDASAPRGALLRCGCTDRVFSKA